MSFLDSEMWADYIRLSNKEAFEVYLEDIRKAAHDMCALFAEFKMWHKSMQASKKIPEDELNKFKDAMEESKNILDRLVRHCEEELAKYLPDENKKQEYRCGVKG